MLRHGDAIHAERAIDVLVPELPEVTAFGASRGRPVAGFAWAELPHKRNVKMVTEFSA
jgi:hypothetical protein